MWLHLDGVKTGRLRVALTVEGTLPVDERGNNSFDSLQASGHYYDLDPKVQFFPYEVPFFASYIVELSCLPKFPFVLASLVCSHKCNTNLSSSFLGHGS